MVTLQHAPARLEYDGFPGYKLHPLPVQIKIVELLSEKKVVAINVNHEGLLKEDIPSVCAAISKENNRPALDVLQDGGTALADLILTLLKHV